MPTRLLTKEKEMKAVLGILGLFVAMQAYADTMIKCTSEKGETVQLHSIDAFEGENWQTKATVEAELASGKQVFVGAMTDIQGFYQLKDANGETASLEIVTPVDHGNRCGRCASNFVSLTKYGKFKYKGAEIDLTCYDQNN
jgi:hypothetical protein